MGQISPCMTYERDRLGPNMKKKQDSSKPITSYYKDENTPHEESTIDKKEPAKERKASEAEKGPIVDKISHKNSSQNENPDNHTKNIEVKVAKKDFNILKMIGK